MERRSNIFINYRREDSAGHAGRLFDRLSHRFPDRVFMDVDTIEPGIDFVDIIEQAVGSCEVLIVMIGRDWLHLADAAGKRRLDNESDFVRLEIAAALDRNIRIIPVLVEGAAMPRPEDLPPDLAKLTRRNAIELSDARWAFDVDRLIQTIETVLQEKAPSAFLPVVTASQLAPPQPAPSQPTPARLRRRKRTRAWMALNAAVLLILAAWLGWSFQSQPAPQILQGTTPVSAPAPALRIPARPPVSRQPAAAPRPTQTAQKTTLKAKTASVLKTAGKGITSLVRKVKRESPRRR